MGFLIRDSTNCQQEFNVSQLSPSHIGMRRIIYPRVLNRGRKGVRSPADTLVHGLSLAQLSWSHAGLYSMPTLCCGYR
jgi:hypothetical protein